MTLTCFENPEWSQKAGWHEPRFLATATRALLTLESVSDLSSGFGGVMSDGRIAACVRVWALGSRVRGWRFGFWDVGFGVWGSGFGVWDLGFGVWGLGFGIWGLGFRV